MDKSSYDTTSDSDKPVYVSAVAAPTSASSIDISIPQDRALPQNHMVAVGRSDGSVFIVKLGDSYLTLFMPVPKLLVVEGEEDDDSPEENGKETDDNGWQLTNGSRVELAFVDARQMRRINQRMVQVDAS